MGKFYIFIDKRIINLKIIQIFSLLCTIGILFFSGIVSNIYGQFPDTNNPFQYYDSPILENIQNPNLLKNQKADSNTTLIGRWANGPCDAVDTSGNFILFGNGAYLEIADISDPGNPVKVGKMILPSQLTDISVQGNYAFVTIGYFGLQIINISIPSSPFLVSFYETGGLANGIAVSGNYVYVACYDNGMRIIDISTISAPIEVGFFHASTNSDVAINGNYAYYADLYNGLYIIDISTPASPFEVGHRDSVGRPYSVKTNGNYAYLACSSDSGLVIVDVTNPASPFKVGRSAITGTSWDVTISGNYAYVAASSGLRIIDITTPASPFEVGFYAGGGNNIAVSGSITFLANGRNGLNIIDVSTPTAPFLIGHFETANSTLGVEINGNYAYLANIYKGLYIIDISSPTSPVEIGFTPISNSYNVFVKGDYAYIADGFYGLTIVNISNPAMPITIGSFDTPGTAYRITLRDNLAFIADREGGLRIFDITTPTSPFEIGFFDTGSYASDVALSGDYAYIADDYDGLRIIDISDPVSPFEAGFFDTGGVADGIDVVGNYAYIADGSDGLRIIDISDPALPFEEGFYNPGSGANFYSVRISGDYAYATDYSNGLRIINITDPASPYQIGYYETGGAARDITAIAEYSFIADGTDGFYIIENNEFIGTPALLFSTDSLNFPQTAIDQYNEISIFIRNTGTSYLNISSKHLNGTNPSEFSVTQGAGSSIIAPGDSEIVVLRFSPTSIGPKFAYLVVNSDALSSPDTLILTGSAVDSGWFSQTSGTTTWLRSVHFIDNQTGWTVGVGGTILHTTDSGLNWTAQNSGISSNLNSVYFADNNNGWAVGVGGDITYTSDGGLNWALQTSNTINQLTSVYFIDNQNGWTVGNTGTILNTSDGGLNWTPQTSGTAYWLSSVCFSDSQNGWIVGDAGIILHTSDAGQNWNTQTSATSSWLLSVSFSDIQNGWAVDQFGTIIFTNDSGLSWNTQINPSGNWLSSIYFNDNQNGWAVGNGGTIIYTTNGGQNWDTQSSPITIDLESVYFNDNQSGWIVGMSGNILHTIDGGGGIPLPVIQFSPDSLNYPLTAVNGNNNLSVTIYNTGTSDLSISTKYLAGIDPTEFAITQGTGTSIIAPGDSEQVVVDFSPSTIGLKSAYLIVESDAPSSPDTVNLNGIAIPDSGWLHLASGTLTHLRSVHFIDSNIGWVCGYNGLVLKSINSGLVFTTQNSGTSNVLYSIFFVDSNIGWALGEAGVILHTIDGGNTWIPQTSGTTDWFYNSFFIDANTGWAVTNNGLILHTTNSGTNWVSQNSGTSDGLPGIYFSDINNGWVVGELGLILNTNDGGNIWSPQNSGTSNLLTGIEFIGLNSGWAVGDSGTILHTIDGGSTWITQNSGTLNRLDCIQFNDINTGWVAGENGIILNTNDGGSTWIPQNSGTIIGLRGMCFIDAFNGWAVGDSGTIIYTINGGSGVQIPLIQFSSNSLSYPQTLVGGNNELPVIISNIGNSNLNINSKIISGTNSSEFTITQGGGTSTIAIGDSEEIIIRFTPTSTGPKSAWFIVNSNSPSSPDTIQLTGNNTPVVQINNTPVNDSDIGMTITPPQNYNPTISRLYYRIAGESNWQMTDLNLSGSNYTGNIDSSYTTIRGLEYYVYFDDRQTVITYPAVNPQSNPAIIQVQVDQLTSATQLVAEKYKMISVPLELADSTISSVLVDDYGTYDKKKWRLLSWNQTINDYFEYPNLSGSFLPGSAFWLIHRDGLAFDIENGESIRSDSASIINLESGWNQVANPFAFNVAWDSIANSQLLNNPVYWDGDNYDYTQTTLQPWEGYFVYNDSNAITISVPPRASGTVLEKPTNFADIHLPEFIIQITATGKQDNQTDLQNYVGMFQNACDGFDVTDFPQAPAIIEKMELSITDKDKFYAGNFKSISKDGAYWDLQLSNPGKNKDVQIEMNQMSEIPENFETWLLDLDKFKPLSITNNRASIKITNSNDKRNLRLIIGTEEFAEQVSDGIPLQPVSFALFQNYPNPFNPNTTIKYQLAERVKVRLEIYNILGQRIKTLVQSSQNTGLHQVIWDGKNDNGKQVGSSVFIYRIQAGSFNKTRKMILIR